MSAPVIGLTPILTPTCHPPLYYRTSLHSISATQHKGGTMKARLVLLAASTVLMTAASPRTLWNTEIGTIWNRSTRVLIFANPENPNGTLTVLINQGLGGNGTIVPWCDNDWELQNKAIKVYRMEPDGRSMSLQWYLCQDYRTDIVTVTYASYKWTNRYSCSTVPISKAVITVDAVGGAHCTKA